MSFTSPSIVFRQESFAVLELWLDREREAFPFLREKKSPPTPIMPGAYNFKESMQAFQSPSKDQKDSRSTSSLETKCLTNLNVDSVPRLPSTLKNSTTSSISSPQSATTTSTSRRRKSLGSEMGLLQFSSCSNSDLDGNFKSGENQDYTDQSHDTCNSAQREEEDMQLSPDTSQSRSNEDKLERKIIVIEMEEDDQLEGSVTDQSSHYETQIPGNIFKMMNITSLELTNNQHTTRQRNVNFEEEEEEIEELIEDDTNTQISNQIEFYAANGVHYLDPVEEVTEEPTMIEWTESEIDELEEEDNMNSSNSTPKLIRTFSPDSTNQQSSEREKYKKLHEWAQLHGLATPSSFAGSPSRSPSKSTTGTKLMKNNKSGFGWAEVISKARYSVPFQEGSESQQLNKIDKVLVYANAASTSAKSALSSSPALTFSPANVIGLRSTFWMSSPTKVTLEHQLLLNNKSSTEKRRLVLSPLPPTRRSSMFNLLQSGVENMVQVTPLHDRSTSSLVSVRSSMEPSGLSNESGWLDGATDSPIPSKPIRKPRWSNLIQDKLSTLATSRSRIPSDGSGSSKRTV